MCLCIYMCCLCFFFGPFPSACFILFQLVCFVFYCTFYHYPLDAFLFSNKTERGWLWMGGEVGKNLEERGGELEYIV